METSGKKNIGRKMFIKQALDIWKENNNGEFNTPLMIGHIEFTRVWIQGIIVSISQDKETRTLLIDDASAVILVDISKIKVENTASLVVGSHVSALGTLIGNSDNPGEPPSLHSVKVSDLSSNPDRETLWHLEVVEIQSNFYLDTVLF